jgi:hypothetical protein
MSIRQLVIRAATVGAVALPLLMDGCVSTSGDMQGARLSDNFQIYAPFDNERDWGPSYLVGAPSHQSRIDDTRATPQSSETSPADPKGPPLTGSPTGSPPVDGSAPQAGSLPPTPPQPPP